MRNLSPVLLGAVAVLGLGCGAGVSPVAPPDVDATPVTLHTPRERLELEPRELRVVPIDSWGAVTVRRLLQDASFDIAFSVVDGLLEAQAGTDASGRPVLLVPRAALQLADVVLLPEQLPPKGLVLKRLALEQEGPAALHLRWYGDGTVGWAEGEVTLLFKSQVLLSSGGTSPLETIRLQRVPVTLHVTALPNGTLAAQLGLTRTGAVWQWAGLLETSDLAFTAQLLETTAADPLPTHPELQ